MVTEDNTVLIPVFGIGGRLDNDIPDRLYALAGDIHIALALGYDSMAGPDAGRDSSGTWQADFSRMQPRLATTWTEESNGDWVVNLRRNVYSSYGNEWNADDLVWAFERVLPHGTMASWRWEEIVGLVGIEPVDRYSVRFRLRAPYPTFPNWLISVTPNMVDASAVRSQANVDDPDGTLWLDRNVAGYGAYALEEMTDEHMAFVARENYWQGAPDAAGIDVRVWGDRQDAIDQLFSSRPVLIAGTDPDETSRLLANDDIAVARAWNGHISIEIDFTELPFQDERVRHALAFSVPYTEIRDLGLLNLGREWRSPVKGTSQWHAAGHLPFDYDLREARKLLAAGGYGNGFTSDLYISYDFPYEVRIAEIVAKSWHEIGVDVTLKDIRTAPPTWMPPLHLRTNCTHNLSEPIYDIAHDYAAMNPIFPLPGGAPNVGTWSPRWKKNPAALELLESVLFEKDRQLKRQKFDDLEAMLVNFSSSLFLAEMQHVLVANKGVPSSMLSPDSRFFQALQYQNNSMYCMPSRASRR
jgi:ABC-type transport system substrate-binding protein